ncbi:unnamed protein product [Schistosoma turkestanicum]|nr:unnamed protein product [Schistosoma turkestanicum]
MKIMIWLSLIVMTMYCMIMTEANRKVIFKGAQSYAGYRGGQPTQRRPSSPRRVDINKVQLYGARRNDPTYREGLSELAGLM